LKDRSSEGMHLGNLDNAYAELGETEHALDRYRQHVSIARKLGDELGEASSLRNISLLLAERGDYDRTISCAEAILKIHERINSPETNNVRNQMTHWREGTSPPRVTLWSGQF
jgi:tetratricopeptide (TPR) repeat protein